MHSFVLILAAQQLLLLLAFAFVAWCAGALALRLPFASRLEALFLRITFGLGALGLALLLLGLLGILRAPVVLIIAAAIVVAALAKHRTELAARPTAKGLLIAAAGAAALALPFALTLYPPASWDDTMYHLPYAKEFAKSGSVPLIPHLRFPIFPQLWEMLYAAALLTSSDLTAQGIHFLAVVLIGLGVAAFAMRFASPEAGWLSAAAWLGNPTVLMAGTAAYVDVGLALFAQAALHCLEAWRRSEARGWLLASGAFAGFAAGTKYFGLFLLAAIPLAAFVFARWRIKPALQVLAIALAVASPWYLRTTIHTGNPVHPMRWNMSEYRASLAGPESRHLIPRNSVSFLESRFRMLTKESKTLWRLPYDVVFDPKRFGAVERLSFAYVLLLPIGVIFGSVSRTARPWAAIPIAYFAVWLGVLHDRRFLLVALPMLTLAGLAPFAPLLRRIRPALPLLALLLLLPGLLFCRRTLAWRGAVPLTPADRDGYLTRAYPFYPALRYLNETRGDRYSLYALFCEQGKYYADGVMWGDFTSGGAYRRVLDRRQLRGGPVLLHVLEGLGATYLLVDRNRVEVRLPEDAAFRTRFRPVFARARLQLYEVSPSPFSRVVSENLVANGGFETRAAWSPHLDCRFERESVGCSGEANLSQPIAVEPGIYEMGLRTRADAAAMARLQINWADAAGAFLGADIEVVPSETQWQAHTMLVSVPEGAAAASVYVQTHEGTAAWFDDVSLRRIDFLAGP